MPTPTPSHTRSTPHRNTNLDAFFAPEQAARRNQSCYDRLVVWEQSTCELSAGSTYTTRPMNIDAQQVNRIASENFAAHLGAELVESATDRVSVRLPYQTFLGVGRVHGGAISALIDIAATAAFWSHPSITTNARGATVGFTINFLKLAIATDLTATATVRRRGGTLCTGNVSVTNPAGDEIAVAIVTYKLSA